MPAVKSFPDMAILKYPLPHDNCFNFQIEPSLHDQLLFLKCYTCNEPQKLDTKTGFFIYSQ